MEEQYGETLIKQFAERHRLKTKTDACGDTIIPGRCGDIFDGFVSGLGVCVMHSTVGKWNNARRAMEAAGFTIRQDGDTEGAATFDPANKTQSQLALKLARVKTRRTMSPAQLAAITKARMSITPVLTT